MKSLFKHIRTFTFTLALITTSVIMAQDVTYQQAVGIASDFFKSKGLDVKTSTMRRVRATAPSFNGNNAYYIINNDNAFAVVAGDSRVTPILAYSLDGSFDEDNVPPGAAYLLDMYEEYINALTAGEVEVYRHNLPTLTQDKTLVTATWNQGWEPWWDKCPGKTQYHYNCYAGCVATAMSIIMRYHNWPQSTGYGSKTYTTATHKFECTANFSATDYKISTIPMTANEVENGSAEVKDAISTLLYHAGVAASMDYDYNGSGTSDINAFIGICRYFGYQYGGWAVRSDYISDDDYLLEIVHEIDANRPMLYSGNSKSGGGHMFVCDGYDSDYRLHFNFGWSGTKNGYYSIFETEMTYYNAQGAIFGIRPNPNAFTASHPLLYFAESGDKYPPIVINSRINNSNMLNIGYNRLFNMTEGDIPSIDLSYRLFDSDGNLKVLLKNWTIGESLKYNCFCYGSDYITLPNDYTYTPGDCIKLFYSEDGRTTWHEIERYEKANYLDLALLFDKTLADLKMYNNQGDCPGLYVSNGTLNADGTKFTVCPGNLYNYTFVEFAGEVAIFLCDSKDKPKQLIDKRNCTRKVNTFNSDLTIDCSLQSNMLAPGDRLVAFCRPTGKEEWSMIDCDDPDKYYIPIPDALIPSTHAVAFNGLLATYSSDQNLDFSSINDYYAYTVTLLDSETLALNRINQVPSGVGVLLLGNNGANDYSGIAAILSSAPSAPDNNLLIGVLENTVVNNTVGGTEANYIFKTSPEIGFYLAEGETVPAGTAYMRISGSPSGAPARFTFGGGGQSGVFSVAADTFTDNTIYNLQGMKVTKPGPGIYIIGGKKVIIR